MRAYNRTHLGDGELMQELRTHVLRERGTTAEVLADIAEVDERRLYVPAGYPSMFEYCVKELGLSEQAALKRIRVAQTARRFPQLPPALADGRLNLTGVILLTPHLTRENADDLLVAAAKKRNAEIERMLAERFPKPDVPEMLRPVAVPASAFAASSQKAAPGPDAPGGPLSVRTVEAPRPSVTPLAPQRYALQTTISESTSEKLQYAKELLSHQLPSGDLAGVLDRALDALIEKLEKRKFAATDRPRKQQRKATNKRTVPAHVRREVWRRDEGRCTFVGTAGQRCSAKHFLEFDHIEPVARGGLATSNNLRLRCRAHNQFEADCVYGAGFMRGKREKRLIPSQRPHPPAQRTPVTATIRPFTT